jgi:PKD repeat protein
MKMLIAGLLALTMLISSCQKDNGIGSDKATTASTDNSVIKPTAFFRISNRVNDDMVVEGSVLDIDNRSAGADFYYWDFGNGIGSSDKNPMNVSFNPCGRTYTITLTVQNRAGDIAVYSHVYTLLCNGAHPPSGG